MNKQETYELIERYLRHELNDAERKDFERQVEQNPTLAAEVSLHRQLTKALGNEQLNAFHQKLQVVEQDFFESSTSPTPLQRPIRRRSWWLVAAASITLIVLAGTFWWNQQNQSSPAKLFASHFEPYDAHFVERGSDTQPQTTLASAFQAYQQKDYSTALRQFNQVLATDEGNERILFYKGICHLALNQATDAIASLSIIASTDNHPFATQSKWYLALSYLLDERPEQAQPILKALSSETSVYQQKANSLLNQVQ